MNRLTVRLPAHGFTADVGVVAPHHGLSDPSSPLDDLVADVGKSQESDQGQGQQDLEGLNPHAADHGQGDDGGGRLEVKFCAGDGRIVEAIVPGLNLQQIVTRCRRGEDDLSSVQRQPGIIHIWSAPAIEDGQLLLVGVQIPGGHLYIQRVGVELQGDSREVRGGIQHR